MPRKPPSIETIHHDILPSSTTAVVESSPFIKQGAAEYREQQAAADQLLFELSRSGRQISPDEKQFLLSIGRLKVAESSYRSRAELDRLVSIAGTVVELRDQAGVENNRYQNALDYQSTVSVDNATIRSELNNIESEITALQARRHQLQSTAQSASRAVEAMEHSRRALRAENLVPGHVTDSYQSAVRTIAETIEIPISETESEIRTALVAIDFHGAVERNDLGPKEAILRFAERHGLTDSRTENSSILQSLNRPKWDAFVAEQQERLPTLQSRLADLKNELSAASEQAEGIRNFWLEADPWAEK